MAEKRKPAKMANRNVGAETIKDDGDKYAVVRDGSASTVAAVSRSARPCAWRPASRPARASRGSTPAAP